ncbi:hypothetical protein KXR64_22565 [Brucella intermedia]|uniref:hypothetical protein n=1 Tax=Brucella TaxID=234 RepID=UPI0011153EDB|nr:hypothetical protein [Brucella intermedia]
MKFIIPVVIAILLMSGSNGATSAPSCFEKAIGSLKEAAPESYAIYHALSDKSQFKVWLKCDDMQLDLTTAVHESVHTLTEELDAYPLISGDKLPRLRETAAFVAPNKIRSALGTFFGRDDLYIQTYLDGEGSSSADDFTYLLDELNAYSHDLHVATKLSSLERSSGLDVDHRDGLAAMMAFLIAYLENARTSHPATWKGLGSNPVRSNIKVLWRQAEETMNASCAIPGFGTNDVKYLKFVCSPARFTALSTIIGRVPQCSSICVGD